MATPVSGSDDTDEDNRGTLLFLPQTDLERPNNGVSAFGSKKVGVHIGNKKENSTKPNAKKADLLLFEVSKSKDGMSDKDLWEGRCKILANSQYASLVTPSTSLRLVRVGTSNSLVLWNTDKIEELNRAKNQKVGRCVHHREESPTKRRKTTKASELVAPCRLVQPGGNGSSFLVGQPRNIDPEEISNYFTRQQVGSSNNETATTASISTNELCNLFQVAPNQIWEAMLSVPSVVSKHSKEEGESWELVPEEEILFGQRALVETLCEEDNLGTSDYSGGENLYDGSTVVTIEAMAEKVVQRLMPLLLTASSSKSDNIESDKEHRCLAIARKSVLLSSSSSYSKKIKIKLNDFDIPYRPDASRIAFYALRDLFLKYPSYAWSDLSEKWSTRLPFGERYEKITSSTEWIEDEKMGGHGGLIPNQLIFSSSDPVLEDGSGISKRSSSSVNEETNLDDGKSKRDSGNPKAVLSLVNPHAVLVWKATRDRL